MSASPEPTFLSPPPWWNRLSAINHNWFRLERSIVIVLSALMALAVFAKAALWLFLQDPSPPMRWASALFPVQGSTPPSSVLPLFVCWLIWSLLVGLAVKSSENYSSKPARNSWRALWWSAWAFGPPIFGVLLARLLPNGIYFGEKLAMLFFVWTMMLGASMAVYQNKHLYIGAAKKIPARHNTALQSKATALLATLFCAALAWASAVYVSEAILRWHGSNYTTGMMGSLPIPDWVMTLIIPIAFGSMAARFAIRGLGTHLGIDTGATQGENS